jgi:hypothetical protein
MPLAYIQFLDGGPVDPGYGQGRPIGGRPDNSLPGFPPHPGNALPPPGSIATLPVFPFDPTDRPDNSLPGSGGRPDNSLPGSGSRPDNSLPSFRPGMKFVMKWLACHGLILVPDNSLPGTPVSPDNELPETGEPK